MKKAYENPLSVRGIGLVQLCKCGNGTLDKLIGVENCSSCSTLQVLPRPCSTSNRFRNLSHYRFSWRAFLVRKRRKQRDIIGREIR